MSFIKKFQSGSLIKKDPIKYKIKFDDGEADFEQEEFEKELLNSPEYVALDENEREDFRKNLESKYSQAGQFGNLKISSIGGKELSGIEGVGSGLEKFKSEEEINAIKNRKERRAAREAYNINSRQNRIFANAALSLRNRKQGELLEKEKTDKIKNRSQYLEDVETGRNYFGYKYGKHQAGPSRQGQPGINEFYEFKRLSGLKPEELDKELIEFSKANYDKIMKADENDEELSEEFRKNYGFDLKGIKQQLSSVDPNTREGAIKTLQLTRNDLKSKYLYDPEYLKSLLSKESEIDTAQTGQATQSEQTQPTQSGVTKDDKGNISIDSNAYNVSEEDVYEPIKNKYIFGGKDLGYKGFYDTWKSDTKLGEQFRTKYPDFLSETKTIQPGINSNLININEAKKLYGNDNSIIPQFVGFSHVLDLSNTMDFFNQHPEFKVVKAANEGVMQREDNPYSNVQENTYTFIVHNDNGRVKKYKASESKDDFGNIVYQYKDDKGDLKTIKTKTSEQQPDNTPFIFRRNYTKIGKKSGSSLIPGVGQSSDVKFNPAFKTGGFIPKFQKGNSIYFGDDTRKVETKKTSKQEKASVGDVFSPDYKLSSADKLQAGALAADIGSLALSFVPGANLGAAAVGVGGTGAQLASDIQREGLTAGNVGNAALNLGLDIASTIPFAGGVAKATKLTKTIKNATKLLTAYGLTSAANAAIKISSDPLNASIDDIQQLVGGLRSISGGRKQTKDVYQGTVKPESTFKVKVGDQTKDIKLNKDEVNALKGLDTSDQAKFLKNKAKETEFKEVDLEKINLISEKRKKTLSSRYNAIKDKTPFLKGSGKSIDEPVYVKTKDSYSPYTQEDIDLIKSKEGKWDFNYKKINGDEANIKLSPIYRGYKRTFGIPTAGNSQRKLNKMSFEESGIPISKGDNTKIKVKEYKNKDYKKLKGDVEYNKKEQLDLGEYNKFIKENPEFKGKSPEEIISVLQKKSLKDADSREAADWSKKMNDYSKIKKEKQPEIDKLNKSEKKRVEEAKSLIDKKDKKDLAKEISSRKEERLKAKDRIEKAKIADDISKRKETREKAKSRLSEYKKKIEQKTKESIESNKKESREKEVAEYKRKKAQNKKIGKERAKEVAKNKELKKNIMELEHEKTSEKNQKFLESATQGRKNRLKIQKAQKGLNIIKPKFSTEIIDKQRYKSAIQPLGFNTITPPSKLSPSEDLLKWNKERIASVPEQITFKEYLKPTGKDITKNISSSIKSFGSKIDPVSLSETGRAIANMIANRGMDTGVDVGLQQSPSEVYQREAGIGATSLANKEANRLISSTNKNLTSDAKLNYQLLRDSENKANSVRERGLQQDIENANRIRETNIEKAAQYGNIRSQIAGANANMLAQASNQKRTMGNQIRLANADIVNSLWASENAKLLQKKEAENAYDRLINENLIQSNYENEIRDAQNNYDRVWADSKSTPEEKNRVSLELKDAANKANLNRTLGMKKAISTRGLLDEYVPKNKVISAKNGVSISDFNNIQKEIKKDINDFLKELRSFNNKKSLIQYKSSLNKKK